jgi:hypothetical protein
MDLHLLDRTGTIHDLRKERGMRIMLWPSSFKRVSKQVWYKELTSKVVSIVRTEYKSCSTYKETRECDHKSACSFQTLINRSHSA